MHQTFALPQIVHREDVLATEVKLFFQLLTKKLKNYRF